MSEKCCNNIINNNNNNSVNFLTSRRTDGGNNSHTCDPGVKAMLPFIQSLAPLGQTTMDP